MFRILAVLVFLLSWAAPSLAQGRLALLIGNQNYAQKVGPLKNPHNDVALIEASLKKLGFKVTVLKDADYRSMDMALKRYVLEVSRAGPGAISVFYFSGHGVANPETRINYLIPIDVKEPDDERIWVEAFQQNVVIDTLSTQAPKATHFVIFDACRNELHISGPASKALGSDKGFVPVNTMPGILIAYATAPSKTASDAGDGGGAYARALSEEILKPDTEAVSMFRAVQIRVKRAINQDPWLSFPSLPEIYLGGRGAKPVATAPPVPPRVADTVKQPDLAPTRQTEPEQRRVATLQTPVSPPSGSWVLLNAQSIKFTSFDDVLTPVSSPNTLIKRFRVDVKDRAVTLKQVRIIYVGGQEDIIPVDAKVDAGASFGPIELKRGDIKEIAIQARSRLTDATAAGKVGSIIELWVTSK